MESIHNIIKDKEDQLDNLLYLIQGSIVSEDTIKRAEKLKEEIRELKIKQKKVSKSSFLNVNNLRKRKAKNEGLFFLYKDDILINFYTHEKMIIGILIGEFWNEKMDVLIKAVYNGFQYTLGVEKYKSERSLNIYCNNLVKYILADQI